MKALEPFTHPGFPGFPCTAPDIYRAKLFTEQLAQWEKAGSMPNLIYVLLPCDQIEGTRPGSPTPRAMVADNDLALGRIVEAVSKSLFGQKPASYAQKMTLKLDLTTSTANARLVSASVPSPAAKKLIPTATTKLEWSR